MPTWPDDLELLRFSKQDAWTLDDATLGILITGGMGSGKRARFGGIFLCAKKQSPDDCIKLLNALGRTDYIILLSWDNCRFDADLAGVSCDLDVLLGTHSFLCDGTSCMGRL